MTTVSTSFETIKKIVQAKIATTLRVSLNGKGVEEETIKSVLSPAEMIENSLTILEHVLEFNFDLKEFVKGGVF